MWFGRRSNKQHKVFVIGRNKTGTTSVGQALKDLGYRIGNQAKAENFIDDWSNRRFDRIIAYCRSADAFQDIPFSNDYTYQILDSAFPGAKFVLTIRNNSHEWYESLIRFHTKIVGRGRVPTPDDLKSFPYRKRGWIWRVQQAVYGIDESTLYDKAIYTSHYDSHIENVQTYFRDRPNDLLTINLGDEQALPMLCDFLDEPAPEDSMPHLNRS